MAGDSVSASGMQQVLDGVRVRAGNGVEVHTSEGTVHLDPARVTEHAVVTHAHSDHLTAGGYMTAPTADMLRIRKPNAGARVIGLHETVNVNGVDVRLHDAGHILGAAMVETNGVLYTGDFNPTRGLTCGIAEPVPCHTLVTESTYGDARFLTLPPKDLVMESVEAWTLRKLWDGPVALGAYQVGRAQELIALLNRAGQTPIVSPDIAAVAAVYNAHGCDLAYAVAGSTRAREMEEGNACFIVPRKWLRKDHDFTRKLRTEGGQAAYLSGWCHIYSYFKAFDVQAQFALSDHASFGEILQFVSHCEPKRVLTTHGKYKKTLAREIKRRLGIPAEALGA